jgi:ATP adenylyltransferase
MDHLWSPWRYAYVSSAPVTTPGPGACLFCRTAALEPADAGTQRDTELPAAAPRLDAMRESGRPPNGPSPGEQRQSATEQEDAANYVVYRGHSSFVLLNRYPYTSGHLMIAPYAHVASLEEAETATLEEIMRLAQRSEKALRALYRPDGMNLGFNIGASAGAGIAGHIHFHVLPRWYGDTSFMTTVGETRVLPEALETTYARLSAALRNG